MKKMEENNKFRNTTQFVAYFFIFLASIACLGLALREEFNPNQSDPFSITLFISLFVALGPVGIIGFLTHFSFSKEIQEGSKSFFKKNMEFLSKEVKEEIENTLQETKEEIREELKEITKTTSKCQEKGVSSFDKITRLHEGINELGVEGVYSDRKRTYALIKSWITEEPKEDADIVLVGTSLRGLYWKGPMVMGDETIIEELVNRISKGEIDKSRVKILLTHPGFAFIRQRNEEWDRPKKFSIRKEILQSVLKLLEHGIPESCIKLFLGTPTMFGVKTSKWMLINPYPYQAQSFRSFAFVVKRVSDSRDEKATIYGAYSQTHFNDVWQGRNAVPYVHSKFEEMWKSGTDGFFKLGEEEEVGEISVKDEEYRKDIPDDLQELYERVTNKIQNTGVLDISEENYVQPAN